MDYFQWKKSKEVKKATQGYNNDGYLSMDDFSEKEQEYNVLKKYRAAKQRGTRKPKKRGPNPYYKNEPRYSMFGRGLF